MPELYLAEFSDPESCIEALGRLRELGYEKLDAYTPHPLEGMSAALGFRRSRIPRYTLAGGLLGGSLAYIGQWWMNAIDFPINVGGRPAHSAPALIPITFELTILCAAIATVAGLFIEARLGALWQPVDEVPGLVSSSVDRFWIAFVREAPDPEAESLLRELGAREVTRAGARP